jgi:hypothetical protein
MTNKKEHDCIQVSDVYDLIVEMRREKRFNQSDDFEYVNVEEEEYIAN